jgi:HEAT repeat protein
MLALVLAVPIWGWAQPAALKALRDPDPAIAAMAARELGKARDAQAIDPLAAVLRDKKTVATVRVAAAGALALFDDPRAREALKGALKDPDPYVRQVAAWPFLRVVDPATNDLMLPLVKDPDAQVRNNAIDYLVKAREKRAVPAIVAMLADPEPRTRDSMLRALETIKDPASLPAVLASFADDTEYVRLSAIRVACGFGDPAVFEPLMGKLDDAAPRVRSVAIDNLARFTDPRRLGLFQRMLKDEDGGVRAAAARQLGVLKENAGLESILGLHTVDPDPVVRQAVLQALRNFSDARIAQVAQAALTDKEPIVRAAAIGTLEKYPAPDVVAKLLGDYDKNVRREALRVLGVWKAPLVDRYAALLADAEPEVRAQAIVTLGSFDDPKREAILKLFADSAPQVRSAAVRKVAEWKNPAYFDAIAKMLGDADKDVRVAVVQGLANYRDAKCLPLIAPLLKDANADIRFCVAAQCGYFKEGMPLDVVLPLMADDDARVREVTMRNLAAYADPRVVEKAQAALKDAAPGVRREAVNTLKAHKALAALPALREVAVGDADATARIFAAQALVALNDAERLPVLLKLLDDTDLRLRELAMRSLTPFPDPRVTEKALAGLKDAAPSLRREACNVLRAQKTKAAVPALIELLADAALADSAAAGLRELTGQNLGKDQAKWREWLAAQPK